MRQQIKTAVFRAAKALGGFALCRFLMRRRLLILAYHGFQYADEASFRPILFMDPQRFARRLEILKRDGYAVLPLEEAVDRCREGTLPRDTIAITIDDGFFSVLDLAAPLLHEHRFPATLYVTSYYAVKGTPIFRLVIQYLFWKTVNTHLEPLSHPWSPAGRVPLQDTAAADQAMWQIIEFGEAHCDEPGRQAICRELATALGIDFDALRDARGLSLLTLDELPHLAEFGVDVQLHTHRHTFPTGDLNQARTEVRENRDVLEKALGRRLVHFCYPSGVWDLDAVPMLAEESIATATTCQVGFNDRHTNPLALYRFLDQDNLSEIEFEAELSGFSELLRTVTFRRSRTEKVHSARA